MNVFESYVESQNVEEKGTIADFICMDDDSITT